MTLDPKISIALPRLPVPGALAAVVPGLGAPRLVRRSASVATRFALSDTVMAIRSSSFARSAGVPDVFGPATTPQHGASVSMIIVAKADRPVTALLDTLARSPAAASTNVVVVGSLASDFDAARFARVQLQAAEGPITTRIDAAVAATGTDVIVIVFAGVNPAEPAIVDHLVAAAMIEGVADVGCAALRGPGIERPEATEQSAFGLFAVPAGPVEDRRAVQPRWHEIPAGLWPVYANRPTMMAVRRSVYDRVGGLGAFASVDAALARFAARARDLGLVSLCDTRLAVLTSGGTIDASHRIDPATISASARHRLPVMTRF